MDEPDDNDILTPVTTPPGSEPQSPVNKGATNNILTGTITPGNPSTTRWWGYRWLSKLWDKKSSPSMTISSSPILTGTITPRNSSIPS